MEKRQRNEKGQFINEGKTEKTVVKRITLDEWKFIQNKRNSDFEDLE